MIRFFRTIRQSLLAQGRITRYLTYAVGEIALVVVGILIALQINNWNNEQSNRAREVKYLTGIKTDFKVDLHNLADIIEDKQRKTSSAWLLLNTAPPTNAIEIRNLDSLSHNVFAWRTFVPSTKTLDELIGSGNLSFITNDSIKSHVLEVAQKYEDLAVYTAHMRREYDMYLYDRAALTVAQFTSLDWNKVLGTNTLQLKLGTDEAQLAVVQQQWATLLQDLGFRNGLKLAMLNNSLMRKDCKEMVREIEATITLIDQEIQYAP
jgi:hypothetical protein